MLLCTKVVVFSCTNKNVAVLWPLCKAMYALLYAKL